MTCTTQGDAEKFSIRVQGERRSSAIFHILAGAIFIGAVHYLIYGSIARLCAEAAGFSWVIGTVLRQQFGVSELTVDSDGVTLNRHTFGVGRTKRFPRADVERLGYEVGDRYDDAALGLMIRTVMMPLRFAHGIQPSEVTLLFDALRTSGSWLGGFVRSVGIPLF